MRTYHFVTEGSWSGGGTAFLNNASHAAKRHKVLNGDNSTVPIIARNFRNSKSHPRGKYVLAPQNALPWNRVVGSVNEVKTAYGLRALSEISMNRASAILRISSSIPEPFVSVPLSPVIHNVLDTGFEDALKLQGSQRSSDAHGRFVSIGSSFSYKNLDRLASAYRIYREGGGSKGLLLIGALDSNRRMAARIRFTLSGLSDVTITGGSVGRAEALAAMRDAHAVVLPSMVEASPLTALEAAYANPNVVLSDIAAHREIFGFEISVPEEAFFAPDSVGLLAQSLWRADQGPLAMAHEKLSKAEYREEERVKWGDSVAEWLEVID